jgi:hypothetical protein
MSHLTDIQYRAALRRNMHQCFNRSELKLLCDDLGIDFDDFPPEGKSNLVLEIIRYVGRHRRLDDLVENLKINRPKINWEKKSLLKGQENARYVRAIADTKHALDIEIHDTKFYAEKIDMLGVSLYNFLGEMAYDSREVMVKRLIEEYMQLRIIFVHPQAVYLKQRSIEDNNAALEVLLQRQRTSVINCLHFYKELNAQYDQTVKKFQDVKRGWVEIKLINFCPYLTIERYDFDIYWGFYSSDTAGIRNPTFLATFEENFRLYNKLKKHFSALLVKGFKDDPEDLYLVRMGVDKPCLNRPLAEDILSKEVVASIIDE